MPTPQPRRRPSSKTLLPRPLQPPPIQPRLLPQPPPDETGVVLEEDNTLGMAHDLSPWGMYQNADVVVKAVMIGLAIASIITWTIWIAKGFELLGAKRRLRTEIVHLKKATTLKEASEKRDQEGHPGQYL